MLRERDPSTLRRVGDGPCLHSPQMWLLSLFCSLFLSLFISNSLSLLPHHLAFLLSFLPLTLSYEKLIISIFWACVCLSLCPADTWLHEVKVQSWFGERFGSMCFCFKTPSPLPALCVVILDSFSCSMVFCCLNLFPFLLYSSISLVRVVLYTAPPSSLTTCKLSCL